MSSRRGFPVVLSAASGTGKTTLSRLMLEGDDRLTLSISFTTRAPRGEERDGEAYHFVDRLAFEEKIAQKDFIEYAEVFGNYYGSSRAWTEDTLEEGHDVLFDIDVQGGKQIRDLFPDACLVFLVPPSMDVLENRLRNRGTDDEETVELRLKTARQEIAEGLATYDYVLTNGRLDRALFDLTSIVRAHRLRALDRAKIHQRLLGDLN